MRSRHWTQANRLGHKLLYPLCPLASPLFFIVKQDLTKFSKLALDSLCNPGRLYTWQSSCLSVPSRLHFCTTRPSSFFIIIGLNIFMYSKCSMSMLYRNKGISGSCLMFLNVCHLLKNVLSILHALSYVIIIDSLDLNSNAPILPVKKQSPTET